MRQISLSVLAAATALLALACGGQSRPPSTQPQPQQRYPYTEADVRFMSDMIRHHGQALVMAGLAPSRSASPTVRTLAERIASGQQDEIALMQQWLRDRQQPVTEPAGPGDHSATDSTGHAAGQGHSHGGHDSLMPGMLTQSQLDELDRARGRDFDRLFLQYMIQHHRGALAMVDRLFATPGAAREEPTFKLANDVSADQSSEITRMERMLAEFSGAGGQ
ncbi:MAG TPA: DUF305 domain-containing protein [Gemmatimonadales bacterium]|nr:DUF305 domain-containing protein [Gemmatimonadales bacterium]